MKKCMIRDEGLIKPISILLILLVFGGILAIAIINVSGMPPAPLKFKGNVSINGLPAPESTVIEAYINGELKSDDKYIVYDNGEYMLYVSSTESDDGEQIIFKINGYNANQTATFIASATPITQVLDLSVDIICGDVNGDGTVDKYDVNQLVENEFDDVLINECVGDVDGNEVINVLDARLLMNHVSNEQGYPIDCGCN